MSDKIKLKNLIVSVLRSHKMTKVAATEIAKDVVEAATIQLTQLDGQLVIGKVGKLYCKKYEAGVYYNPSKKAKVPRDAYKTVRFRPFAAAKKKI